MNNFKNKLVTALKESQLTSMCKVESKNNSILVHTHNNTLDVTDAYDLPLDYVVYQIADVIMYEAATYRR